MKEISLALVQWFKQHKRDLPWRQTSDWYPVFLSEFLLQQTQVTQALPYYQKFIRRFPTIFELARSNEDDILQMWAGLGYYSRARNLLKAARQIVTHFNGRFPADLKTALTLPGIGPYTAAAVLSIAFNQPLSVVDGNVIRVISRLFAIEDDVRLSATRKAIQLKARQLLLPTQAGLFNEAIMELGALICKPAAPLCAQCPLQTSCQAFHHNKVDAIPFKSSAPARKKQFHLVFVIRHGSYLLVGQRPGKGMLAGMWEFPTIELPAPLQKNSPQIAAILSSEFPQFTVEACKSMPILKQIYTHIHLQYRPILLQSAAKISFNSEKYIQTRWIRRNVLEEWAIHKAHQKILQHAQFKQWWMASSVIES
ncbi:A/G-specific adenine glycosylase [Calditrichota bacterium LG25]